MLDSLLLARNDPLSHVGGPDGRAEKHAVTVEQPLSWIAFAAGIAHEQPSPSAATDNSFARSDVAERTIELATLWALLSEGPAVPVLGSRAGRLPVGPTRHDRRDVRDALGRVLLVRGLGCSESSPFAPAGGLAFILSRWMAS